MINLLKTIEEKVFIVAELSANHAQDLSLAKETIHAMKEAGADAVKLQTYKPDTVTINSEKDYFQIRHGTPWDGITLYDLYGTAYMPWEWHQELKELSEKLGLFFFLHPQIRKQLTF